MTAANLAGRPVLVMMSRWPAFGRCKRRLGATIGSRAAATVQARLRTHTLTVAQELHNEGLLSLRLALSGGPSRREQQRLSAKVIDQGKGGLGLRMRRQMLEASKGNSPHPVLIIGTDLPDLSRRDLCCAIEALHHHPLVLGPARDGGYWLLGLGQHQAQACPAWLFSGLPWGSEHVLSTTLQRAQSRGWPVWLLDEHNDIDRMEDLSPWLA